MNLYSSSSNCGNCGKQFKRIVILDVQQKRDSGKKNVNVD